MARFLVLTLGILIELNDVAIRHALEGMCVIPNLVHDKFKVNVEPIFGEKDVVLKTKLLRKDIRDAREIAAYAAFHEKCFFR